jgi:hypothetical protein
MFLRCVQNNPIGAILIYKYLPTVVIFASYIQLATCYFNGLHHVVFRKIKLFENKTIYSCQWFLFQALLKATFFCVKFEVLTEVIMQITEFLDVTPCDLVAIYNATRHARAQ